MRKRIIVFISIFIIFSIAVVADDLKTKVVFLTIDKNIDNKFLEDNIIKYTKEELAAKNITAEDISVLEEIIIENNMSLKELNESGILKEIGVAGVFVIKTKVFRTTFDKVKKIRKTEIEIGVKNILNDKEIEKNLLVVETALESENGEEELIIATIKKTGLNSATEIYAKLFGQSVTAVSTKSYEKNETIKGSIDELKSSTVDKSGINTTKSVLDTGIKKEILLGKFMPESEKLLKVIPAKYLKYKRKMYTNEKCYDNLIKMLESAEAEGVKIQIISSWRSIEQQKYIWNNMWREETLKLLKDKNTLIEEEMAATILSRMDMPGVTSYHWGSDIEIESTDKGYFETEKGKRVYEWMKNNGEKFSFVQVDDKISWRWRNIEISKEFAEEYIKKISYNDIKDFSGYKTAENLGVIENKIKKIVEIK